MDHSLTRRKTPRITWGPSFFVSGYSAAPDGSSLAASAGGGSSEGAVSLEGLVFSSLEGSLLLGSGSLLLSSVLPASLDSSELVSLLGGGSVEVSELLLSEGGSELLVSLEVSELLGGGVLLLPVLLLVLLELLGGGVAASFTELMAFWTSLQLPALFMAEASLSLASWVFRAAMALS